MNNTKALVVGATLGAVIGWIVATIVTDELYPEYYTQEELEELNTLTTIYRGEEPKVVFNHNPEEAVRINPTEVGVKSVKPVAYNEAYFKEHPEKAPLKDLVKKFNNDEEVPGDPSDEDEVDFSEMFSDSDEMADEKEEENTFVEDPKAMEYGEYLEGIDTNVDIYIMSQEDFRTNPMKFRTAELHYFEEDDVVTDAKYVPLTKDPARFIGEIALFNFGVFTDYENQVYVSNPIRATNYIVTRHEESYDNFISGKTETRNVFNTHDNRPPEDEEGDDIS